MPEKETVEAAQRDLAEGKAPSTAAGEFVKQEIDHVREGKHGVRNTKQAIAIGLSEARRAGVPIPDNPNRSSSRRSGRKRAKTAKRASATGRKRSAKKSRTRARAVKKALKRMPKRGASKRALSRQAKQTARKRGAAARSASAKKAARTRARTSGRKKTATKRPGAKRAKRSRR
jgi:hypothetical protein